MAKIKLNTKFARLLYKHHISIRALAEHAQMMGYSITNNLACDVVNHSRNFNVATADKLIEAINDMTGEKYTFDDIHDPFTFE